MKKDLSRRKFLPGTGGAAGALAASPAIFLEPEHIPLPMQSTAPSDRLRFGIIGIGMQGSGLLRDAIQLPGVECIAACDLYDGRHTLAREIVGKKIPTTRRYKDLLDNKEIDCLIAAVPDHWHKQVVVDAVYARKGIDPAGPSQHRPPPVRHLAGSRWHPCRGAAHSRQRDPATSPNYCTRRRAWKESPPAPSRRLHLHVCRDRTAQPRYGSRWHSPF